MDFFYGLFYYLPVFSGVEGVNTCRSHSGGTLLVRIAAEHSLWVGSPHPSRGFLSFFQYGMRAEAAAAGSGKDLH